MRPRRQRSAKETQRVVNSLPFVEQLARRVAATMPHSIDIGDLVQDGVIGLIDAAHRFDESRGIKFETFAERRIRGAMIDASSCNHSVTFRSRSGSGAGSSPAEVRPIDWKSLHPSIATMRNAAIRRSSSVGLVGGPPVACPAMTSAMCSAAGEGPRTSPG